MIFFSLITVYWIVSWRGKEKPFLDYFEVNISVYTLWSVCIFSVQILNWHCCYQFEHVRYYWYSIFGKKNIDKFSPSVLFFPGISAVRFLNPRIGQQRRAVFHDTNIEVWTAYIPLLKTSNPLRWVKWKKTRVISINCNCRMLGMKSKFVLFCFYLSVFWINILTSESWFN